MSPSGVVSRDYPVDVSRPQVMHDFAVTETYAVFMDAALVFEPEEMARRGRMPFAVDTERESRIGLLRRDAPEAGVRWYAVAPFVCFHTATAWDDGDQVHLVLCKCALLPSPVTHPSHRQASHCVQRELLDNHVQTSRASS